ncbi:MAG: MFS transporter [Labrys sp. (in: a-proteobacteria)]
MSQPDTISHHFTRSQVLTIVAAIACITLVGIGLSLTTPLIALLMAAKGYSATLIGLNTAVASVATLFLAPAIPRLAAMMGVGVVLLVALVVGATSLIGFALTDSLIAWFVLRFTFGAAIGTLFVLSEFWINAAAPPTRRGMIMGLYGTALSLGFAAGPTILAIAGGASVNLFFVGAVFFAVAAAPILLAGTGAPALAGESSRGALAFIFMAPVATVAGFAFGSIEQGAFAFLAIYGETTGLSVADAALLLTWFALGNVLFQAPIGALSDKMNRRLVLLVSALVSLAGLLAMPIVAGDVFLMSVAVFVTGGVVGALYTVGLAHLGARFTGAELANANAAFVMLYSLGMLTGAPAIGVGVDLVPPHGFVWATALICGGYALLVMWRMVRDKG